MGSGREKRLKYNLPPFEKKFLDGRLYSWSMEKNENISFFRIKFWCYKLWRRYHRVRVFRPVARLGSVSTSPDTLYDPFVSITFKKKKKLLKTTSYKYRFSFIVLLILVLNTY